MYLPWKTLIPKSLLPPHTSIAQGEGTFCALSKKSVVV